MKEATSIRILYLVLGLIVGVVIFGALRFALYKPDTTHYHANFALYINGQRDEFKDPSFYEEISACSKDDMSPKHRAHMHNNVNDVVHVHDHAVTWGSFLANLDYAVSDKYLKTRSQLYVTDDANKMHFVLNGKDVGDITNTVIGDQDRLLISYGPQTNAQIQAQYATVAATAAQVDKEQDPAACAGAEKISWQDRLTHLLQ